MKFIEMLQLVERVDQLIRLKATGNTHRLANRLNISERTAHRLLNTMKDMGAPIYYNNARCSYCYEKEVEFKFGFKLINNSAQIIRGGAKLRNVNFLNRLPKSGSELNYLYISTL